MSIMRPVPTGIEIKLDPKRYIVSKTDPTGRIVYGNDYFTQISGYKESELVGSPHNILRHPDMPKAIFYLMWEYLKSGRNIMAVVKNLAKNGNHYWVTTDFDIKRDKNGNTRHYIAYRQAAPKHVVKVIEELYAKLLEIEKEHGMKASVEYLYGYLEERNMNYDQFIEELAKPKGLAGLIFEKMKKLFG